MRIEIEDERNLEKERTKEMGRKKRETHVRNEAKNRKRNLKGKPTGEEENMTK